MYIALPPSGPENGGTEVMVVGSGFQDNGKARCRFGVPGDFSIVEGRVLSKYAKYKPSKLLKSLHVALRQTMLSQRRLTIPTVYHLQLALTKMNLVTILTP